MLSKLRQTAQRQAEILQARDEVIGLGFYGSLSHHRLTPFSDIDIFIITTEPKHDPSVEHRVMNGIRADFMWEPLEKWRKIRHGKQGYMPWYLVKALLLGSDDYILYDPQGVIREKQDELRQEISYEDFMADQMAGVLDWTGEKLMMAIWHEEEGRFSQAWKFISGWYANYPLMLLSDLTNHKRIEDAAGSIGIPGLWENIQTVRDLECSVNGYTPEYVRGRHKADSVHWEYQLKEVWQPLRQHLMDQGVDSPEKLEVIGELMLPYGGVRVYELWRAIMEHNFSLEWAEAELERGDLLEAIGKIGYEDIVRRADEKWTRIDDAIIAAGYDTGMIIKNFLASDEFRERTEAVSKALKSPDAIPVTAQHTRKLTTAVYEYMRLLSEHLVSHHPDALGAMPELYSLSRAEIAQHCRDREIRIDNHVVSIIISKEKAVMESLIFKPGTNSNLIETYWIDAGLFDLSSTSHGNLRKKWMLEKEECTTDSAHFVFSQDGGYRVVMDISWSESGATIENTFQLPHPIAINNNIDINGGKWPKPPNDYWATMVDGKVQIGNYAYKPGPHIFLQPSDGSYFTPEGCWIAAWNEDINEVYGFTFSPNCGCIIARGASTDFEFYLPSGKSILRFHIITPKSVPPYLALQALAVSQKRDKMEGEQKSPYLRE